MIGNSIRIVVLLVVLATNIASVYWLILTMLIWVVQYFPTFITNMNLGLLVLNQGRMIYEFGVLPSWTLLWRCYGIFAIDFELEFGPDCMLAFRRVHGSDQLLYFPYRHCLYQLLGMNHEESDHWLSELRSFRVSDIVIKFRVVLNGDIDMGLAKRLELSDLEFLGENHQIENNGLI